MRKSSAMSTTVEILPVASNWNASSTVQFVSFHDEERHPEGWGSGMVVKIGSRRFLLTALHVALLRPGVMLKPHPSLGMEIEKISNWYFFTGKPRTNDGKDAHPVLDFAFIEISDSVDLYRYNVASSPDKPQAWKIREFDIANASPLVVGERCSFCGIIHPQDVSNCHLKVDEIGSVGVDFRVIENVTYDKLEGRIAHFMLPSDFSKTGISLKGTSGSPILNSKKEPVAIVTGGSERDGIVDGIMFSDIKDFLLGKTGICYDLNSFCQNAEVEACMLRFFYPEST